MEWETRYGQKKYIDRRFCEGWAENDRYRQLFYIFEGIMDK